MVQTGGAPNLGREPDTPLPSHGGASRDRRSPGGEGFPGAGLLNLSDGLDSGRQLIVAGVEMRRKTNPRARSIIAKNIDGLQTSGDLVAVLDVDGDGSPAPVGITGTGASVTA